MAAATSAVGACGWHTKHPTRRVHTSYSVAMVRVSLQVTCSPALGMEMTKLAYGWRSLRCRNTFRCHICAHHKDEAPATREPSWFANASKVRPW